MGGGPLAPPSQPAPTAQTTARTVSPAGESRGNGRLRGGLSNFGTAKQPAGRDFNSPLIDAGLSPNCSWPWNPMYVVTVWGDHPGRLFSAQVRLASHAGGAIGGLGAVDQPRDLHVL